MQLEKIISLLSKVSSNDELYLIAQKLGDVLKVNEIDSFKVSSNLTPSSRLENIYLSRLSVPDKPTHSFVGLEETLRVLNKSREDLIVGSIDSGGYKIVFFLNAHRTKIKGLFYL